jgi:hypothetical protein
VDFDMTTFFEIIKRVLDTAYEEIEDSKKDELIKKRLDTLSAHYGDVLSKGGPSYTDEITRFGYVFRYATAHAEFLNGAFNWSPDLRKALDKELVYVTCVGGGPGSDVLGFVKFLLSMEDNRPKLTFYVLDKEGAWADTWGDLDAIVSEEITTSRNFLTIDVTKAETYEKHRKAFNSDVFTLIYFLSEIFKFKKEAAAFLEHCFAKMKKGALLLVLDFKDSRLQEWIDEIAEDEGLDCVDETEQRVVIGSDEQKSVLEDYMEKFGSPKLQGEIMYRLYRKK